MGLSATLLYVYSRIKEGTFAVSDFVVLNMYILQLYIPMGIIGTLWRFIRQQWSDVELVLEYLETDEATKEEAHPIKANISAGEIEFKNVSFTYEADLPKEEQRQILFNLSFIVPAGQTVALVGTTGSGKSTIMRLLYRFYDITEGTITVDGQDISKMKLDDLRSNIGIVPQDCVLFNDTILYNIAYGGVKDPEFKKIVDDPARQNELRDFITPASKRAQFHDFCMRRGNNYFEMVGERGLKLSGGEKQRVAIARALIKKTKIMCFDEATSALDTETERQVQQAIDAVSADSTTLVIAHRLSTVRNADKIIVLKHGEIMEQGKHDDLLKIPNG
jgi:ABC-type multidrug transport system fused ATPase/permease subunit